MRTNAQKIQDWRSDHPGARLTEHNLLEILGHADFSNADFSGADLRGVDFSSADLRGSNLHGARGVLSIPTGLPSGPLTLWRGPTGWRLKVGDWEGAPESLRSLIAQDEGWPEARRAEVARHLPLLAAALVLCDVYIADAEKDKEVSE